MQVQQERSKSAYFGLGLAPATFPLVAGSSGGWTGDDGTAGWRSDGSARTLGLRGAWLARVSTGLGFCWYPRQQGFGTFLPALQKSLAYVRLSRDEKARWLGHSPLGAYAVLLMLSLLLAQVLTGLIADDEIAFTGPLAASVPGAWSAWATWYHKSIGKPALLLMIGLHLSAIAYYAIFQPCLPNATPQSFT